MKDFAHSAKIIAGIIIRRIITGPHSVQVSIVDACNYRCVMCWEHSSEIEGWGADDLARSYHASKKNKATVMDLGIYKDLVTSLQEVGTRQLGLSGIGEPLLHRQIVEAVAFAHQVGMSTWITTNGSQLTPELLDDLEAAGLDDLSVSINAGARDEYGLVHTNQDSSRFDLILENLVWLKEYKQRRGLARPRVHLSNVVSNLNSHRVVEMMETGIKAGAGDVSYRPIDIFPDSSKFALGEKDYEFIRSAFPATARLAQTHGITTNIDTFEKLVSIRAANLIPAPCFAGWLYPFVLANGDVTYCCVSREVLGNLKESSFKEIWYASSRRRLNEIALKIHKTQQPVPRSRCRGCEQMLANLKIYRFLWPAWGKPIYERASKPE